jgi:hypothetical protein
MLDKQGRQLMSEGTGRVIEALVALKKSTVR